MRSRSVRPRTSSMTRKTLPASAPWSYTATALTWDSLAALRASRANRAMKTGSRDSEGVMTLTATSRSSRSSTAA